MADNEYILNGIRFSSATEYQNAKKELEGIEYIKEHNDMSDDRTVLALYNKFVQKNVFRTKAGHRFLAELQDRLMQSEVIDKSIVSKLPIYDYEKKDTVIDSTARVIEEHPVKSNVAEEVSVGKGTSKATTVKSNAATTTATATGGGADLAHAHIKSDKKSNLHMEYLTKNTRTKAPANKEDEYKKKYGRALFLNFVLILVIIAMAYITLNGNNINILNYEARLQDEYAGWAEELAAKEQELNRLERELKEMLGN